MHENFDATTYIPALPGEFDRYGFWFAVDVARSNQISRNVKSKSVQKKTV